MANNTILGMDPKNKIIETEKLLIRGHLLRWNDTVIQISNISMVSVATLNPSFPPWAYLLIAALVYFINDGDVSTEAIIEFLVLMCVLPILFSIAQVFLLKMAGSLFRLDIRMNSGDVYSISFKTNEFMRQVLQLLANIVENGTTPQTNFHINLKECEIRDHGKIVQVNEEMGW